VSDIERLQSILAEARATLDALAGDQELLGQIARLADTTAAALIAGGKVWLFGNGGSAADAQHIAAELVGRFRDERRALAAEALTVNSSVLTAIANDYGFEEVFARQLEAHARSGDVAIGISTSGTSRNVLRGLETAQKLGLHTAALTGGTGGELPGAAIECVIVPATQTARIQECHIVVGHMLCELVERALAEAS
jgi:D-sedoheptulose 7-phosphate isomerase